VASGFIAGTARVVGVTLVECDDRRVWLRWVWQPMKWTVHRPDHASDANCSVPGGETTALKRMPLMGVRGVYYRVEF